MVSLFRYRVAFFAGALCVSLPAWCDVYAEYEQPGTRNVYRDDPAIESRRTDHFMFRFGSLRKEGFLTEQLFQGQMQFMENVYDTWRILGLQPLGGYTNTLYKGIIEPAQTWPGDTPGTAVGFTEGPGVPGIHVPCNSLAYQDPNGCTPHEFGHGWQNQHANHIAGGLPAIQPQGFTESLANWMMQQQLAGYPQDWITVGMPMAHAATGYNCMSIFNYFYEAPGYGSNFINRLVLGTNVGVVASVDYLADDIVRKAIREDTSGAIDKTKAIHDGVGLMNAKMLSMDFWNHRVNNIYDYAQDTNWVSSGWFPAGYFFNRIPMVRQPGVEGNWYRPEWTCTPQTLMNSYIPLTVTATGAVRTVMCDFRPTADAMRGTRFRACFVAFNANREPRYGRVWNAGENAFTLADDEQAVYLAIIASPSIFNASISHNDYTLKNVAMFPYRIKLDGAEPKGWRWTPPASGFSRHANGGGIKADTATVDASAYIGTNAMVLGTARVYGNARIEDYALVSGSAVIGRSGQPDDPVISGHAYVTDSAQIYNHAKVRDYGWVWGTSKVYENGIVMAHTMIKNGTVYGCAVLNQAPLRDTGLCHNGTFSGSAIVGGDTSGLGVQYCDKGVWCEYPAISVADNQYLYLGYDFEKTSSVFAMDRYGMNHSFLINEPQVVGDTVNATATKVLSLNGTNQYVEVRPEAIDFADLTLTVWVKWLGSASNEKLFSFGDGSNKVMALTPKDPATGCLRFGISTGSVTQYLDGASALASNTWTHLALSFCGTTGTLYVAGLQVSQSTSMTIDPDQLHAPLMADANYIGRGNSNGYFCGRIDEFSVYNRALTAGEVVTVKNAVKAGAAPAADVTAPTPNTPAWLVAPTLIGDSAITMSANPATDPNGVLYYFRCTNDSTHDSGWLSENTFTDCKASPGTTYTFTVRMKDSRGNTTSESTALSASAAALDTAAPTPNPPTFSASPKGVSTSAVSMIATAGIDADATVMYKFSRVGSSATSGWTSSRIWTDTGLTPNASYTYTLQMKDGHGSMTATGTSNLAVARDDTPPALDADFRLQWDTYPYVQLNRTVRMYARPQVDTAVQYYYECVEQPAISSGWVTHPSDATKTPTWITLPLTNGTYSFRFKLRDTSPQMNVSSWSATKTATITSNNTYASCSLNQLASLPDSTLVIFTGKVVQVSSTYYVVTNGSAAIQVTPRTFACKTDPALLNQDVTVKGHLWTYIGTPKRVTFATVSGNPQTGKIEFEDCDSYDELARLLYDTKASGSEYLGWHQNGWEVSVSNVAAATQLSIGYQNGGGTISLYTNGTHAANIDLPYSAAFTIKTQTGLNIRSGTTLKFRRDSGDVDPNLDYLILGPSYTVSGKVTDGQGASISNATVSLSMTPQASLDPYFTATTDATGYYSKTVTPATWYVAASAQAQGYAASSDRTVAVSNAAVSNVDLVLSSMEFSYVRTNDLLFACVSDMLPDSGTLSTWWAYYPSGLAMAAKGAPSVEINNAKWEKNAYTSQDGFLVGTYSSPIPVNGASIIVAVKPQRNGLGSSWTSIVDIFYDRLTLGIKNDTGKVCVRRNSSLDLSDTAIPDGQITVVSLVAQSNGQYKVWANGLQVMNITSISTLTNLVNGVAGGYANAIDIGRNDPDGWSTFNGNIGDVLVYKVALSDADRQQLEADLMSKFSSAGYTINASAGSGGTIAPSGLIAVSPGTNQIFTISPSTGYVIADVTVNGVSQGAIGSYTFTNVVTNHTIAASFSTVVNAPPSISVIPDQTIDEDHVRAAIPFTVSDAETPATSLTVTRSSSNTSLVPDANIVLGGSGGNRTVTVTPATNQNGSAIITLTVSDGDLTASTTFTLTVNAVNDAPTISAIADQSANTNQVVGPLAFTVGDVETLAASLTVTGSSSNTSLVPDSSIVFGGSGANRTVTVTPVAGQSGTSTITLTVSDGQLSAIETFVVAVSAVDQVIGITFRNGDGKLTANEYADATLYQNNGNVNTPAAYSIELKDDPTGTDDRIAVIAFFGIFGSGANRIPVGATIQSATLRMVNNNDRGKQNDIYVIDRIWTETGVSWNNFFLGHSDFGTYLSTIGTSSGIAANSVYTIDIKSVMQAWANTPTNNFGLLFRSNGVGSYSDPQSWVSGENTTTNNRPLLTVSYSLPTPLTVWQQAHFGNDWNNVAVAGPDADPDHDGRSNLAEFAFNSDPTNSANRGLLAIRLDDGVDAGLNSELGFIFAARRGAVFTPDANHAQVSASIDGLIYTVSGSFLLSGAWDSVVTHLGVSDSPPAGTGLPDLVGSDWQYQSFSGFDGLPGTGFLRVKVIQP